MSGNAFIKQTMALTKRELKHWYRSKSQIMMALVQPLMWLGLFGMMMSGMMPPEMDFFSTLAMGMIVITALSTAMSSGMSLIWDRRFGFLDKVRAAPISRGAIPLSRVLATTVKALIQCSVVMLIALLLGLNISAFSIWSIPVLFIVITATAMIFSSLFVAFGLVIKNQESFMGINMLLMMPLMFVSGAMFPTSMMQGGNEILKAVANFNPLTYAADALRRAFLESDGILSLPDVGMWGCVAVLVMFAIAAVLLGMFFATRALKKQ
jgi:ABC-type polysaccharide/polyol phosphate export systems, permease component